VRGVGLRTVGLFQGVSKSSLGNIVCWVCEGLWPHVHGRYLLN
jgi:hypothetical protein